VVLVNPRPLDRPVEHVDRAADVLRPSLVIGVVALQGIEIAEQPVIGEAIQLDGDTSGLRRDERGIGVRAKRRARHLEQRAVDEAAAEQRGVAEPAVVALPSAEGPVHGHGRRCLLAHRRQSRTDGRGFVRLRRQA
jgi:hypothetical protein